MLPQDVVLMPETDARRALSGSAVRLSVLHPMGVWAGVGTLRVLRVRTLPDESVELVTGYESYVQLDQRP